MNTVQFGDAALYAIQKGKHKLAVQTKHAIRNATGDANNVMF